ncbi:MAG: hypothetical protein DRP18_04800 [Candidatus Aenigmatarchaeota archaeon]|nr:MAG: hypothetical protein DRP18_04800 [Candidatus Aenigmarchaeota archaeon]
MIDTIYLNVKAIDLIGKNATVHHTSGKEEKVDVDSIEINFPVNIESTENGVRINLTQIAYCEYHKGNIKKLKCDRML